MQKRFLVAMTLALAISACEAESSSTATTTDTAGADTAAGDTSSSDTTAGGDTASSDTAASDAASTDTAGADSASADSAAGDTATSGGEFAKASPVLVAKCATCHTSVPKAKFDGQTCAATAAFAAKIKSEIDKGAMPPKGSPTLSADEKAAILAWVAAGATCP